MGEAKTRTTLTRPSRAACLPALLRRSLRRRPHHATLAAGAGLLQLWRHATEEAAAAGGFACLQCLLLPGLLLVLPRPLRRRLPPHTKRSRRRARGSPAQGGGHGVREEGAATLARAPQQLRLRGAAGTLLLISAPSSATQRRSPSEMRGGLLLPLLA